MTGQNRARRERPPLNQQRLQELGLRYVGRFATTRAKLRTYLARKIKERGWGEARDPDIESLVRRFAELGYINDEAFAVSKARALSGRGYGKRRLVEKLRSAGVEEADRGTAEEHADGQALESALRFAERRRLGPFAEHNIHDPKQREKQLAAMVRAGHDFSLARAIIALPAGQEVDLEVLKAEVRFDAD